MTEEVNKMLSCEIQDEMAFMCFVALVQLEHYQKNKLQAKERKRPKVIFWGMRIFFMPVSFSIVAAGVQTPKEW